MRVHPEILVLQRLPWRAAGDGLWQERCESIREHERHLARNGTVVLKFWLNVSRDGAGRRFLVRLDEPSKNWKFPRRRRGRARPLGRLHDGLRGAAERDLAAVGAVVRDPGRRQALRPRGGGRGRRPTTLRLARSCATPSRSATSQRGSTRCAGCSKAPGSAKKAAKAKTAKKRKLPHALESLQSPAGGHPWASSTGRWRSSPAPAGASARRSRSCSPPRARAWCARRARSPRARIRSKDRSRPP